MRRGTREASPSGRAAVVFAPVLVALSAFACGGTGASSEKPAGVGNQATTGGSGSTGGCTGSGGKGGSGNAEAGEGSGGSSSTAGRGGSGATGAGGGDTASGGLGNEGGSDDPGEAGAPATPLGPEHCSDGLDNDGDGNADCSDDECATECATVCAGVTTVADPSTGPGSNVGHPAMSAALCGASAEGPAVVYSVTATTTGVLEASAFGSGLLRVAIRSACDATDALACGLARASAPVTAGDELFVVVQGVEATDAGDFTLSVLSRELDVCGDGFRDPAEDCDDGNDDPGDGCTAACRLESSEAGDNDALAEADAYEDPYYGAIDPEGDVDSVGFDLGTRASVIVSTENLGDGSCVFGELDSFLELFDENGDSLATDDDGGEGFCARIVLSDLPVGHYTAQLSASAAGDTPTFPYRLLVVTDVCGNGRQTLAEECDDGNVEDGDGCSARCRAE